jgi:hypothetical protein
MPRSMFTEVVSIATSAATIRGAPDRSEFCGPSAHAVYTVRLSIESGRSRRSTLQLLVGHPFADGTPSRKPLYAL